MRRVPGSSHAGVLDGADGDGRCNGSGDELAATVVTHDPTHIEAADGHAGDVAHFDLRPAHLVARNLGRAAKGLHRRTGERHGANAKRLLVSRTGTRTAKKLQPKLLRNGIAQTEVQLLANLVAAPGLQEPGEILAVALGLHLVDHERAARMQFVGTVGREIAVERAIESDLNDGRIALRSVERAQQLHFDAHRDLFVRLNVGAGHDDRAAPGGGQILRFNAQAEGRDGLFADIAQNKRHVDVVRHGDAMHADGGAVYIRS